MNDHKAILWDFDGTLAFHRTRWSGCFLQVLDERFPDHGATLEDSRRLLATGYPWHVPDQPHLHLCDPEEWWRSLETNLATAYGQLGYAEDDAITLARALRELYVRPEGFELYDDVLPALTSLKEQGWNHYILSNHMPELRAICAALGLSELLAETVNSAETGYEKPHPEAFRIAKQVVGEARTIMMVGDNPIADVAGAERAGLVGFLVRAESDDVSRQASGLPMVFSFASGLEPDTLLRPAISVISRAPRSSSRWIVSVPRFAERVPRLNRVRP